LEREAAAAAEPEPIPAMFADLPDRPWRKAAGPFGVFLARRLFADFGIFGRLGWKMALLQARGGLFSSR
jgi:hypothetical protein